MNENEYMNKRIDDQIDWYDRKSQFNQKMYKRLVLIEIVFSASIPFLTSYSSICMINTLIAVFGIGITLIAGMLSLYKFQENWITYRTTAETLKQEKYQYLTKTGVYNDGNDSDYPLNILVNRIESIISKENTEWHRRLNKSDKKKNQ